MSKTAQLVHVIRTVYELVTTLFMTKVEILKCNKLCLTVALIRTPCHNAYNERRLAVSPVERRMLILDRLRAEGKVNLNEIADELQVSSMTIRRDLRLFVEQGIATISSGTAHLVGDTNQEGLYPSQPRVGSHAAQKQAIGRAAAQRIEDGDTIIIDCGSTTLQLLHYLGSKQVTIITNSIPASALAGRNSAVKLIYAPGEYSPDSAGMIGPLTVDFFHTLRADKAFLGAHGFDAMGGVNEPVLGDATTKRAMLEAAQSSFLLVDSSKYGNVHLMALSRLADYSCVITDDDLPLDLRGELEAAYNEVIYAS